VLEPTPLADMLDLLDERRFRLLGRANDLIHVAGKRSSLAHLNFHLNRIDGVQDGRLLAARRSGRRRGAAGGLRGGARAQRTPGRRRLRERWKLPSCHAASCTCPPCRGKPTGKITVATLRQFALRTLAALDAPAPTAVHIAADHPALAGHFPGHPVLPGVALLSLVIQALAQQPALAARLGAQPRIDTAKFLSPVGPGSTLQVQLREQGGGVAFEVMAGSTCAARGQLSAGSA
jgi:3-hydroxymyristoyl/3-hydroxydecanoyl-(acyl carrier protein) dehydratase